MAAASADLILPWQQPQVRDLAWLLGSPPLLPAPGPWPTDDGICWPDAGFWQQQLALARPWLDQLERSPDVLTRSWPATRDHRLGHYAEHLLACWLSWPDNPHYRLLARNLPIDRDGRRFGEADFLLEHKPSGRIEHWELAVKFYLGLDNGCWLGPGQRDRLDLKLQRLRLHQLRLPLRPRPDVRLCLLKGRLFPPAHRLSPVTTPCWWSLTALMADSDYRDWRWLPLPKTAWLAPLSRAALAQARAQARPLADLASWLVDDNRALLVLAWDAQERSHRAALAPPGWPAVDIAEAASNRH